MNKISYEINEITLTDDKSEEIRWRKSFISLRLSPSVINQHYNAGPTHTGKVYHYMIISFHLV